MPKILFLKNYLRIRQVFAKELTYRKNGIKFNVSYLLLIFYLSIL